MTVFSSRMNHSSRFFPDLLKRIGILGFLISCCALFPRQSSAQETWTWAKEFVDTTGRSTSMAVDDAGNVHISYGENKAGLKYGFRPAGAGSKWFTMVLGGGAVYTNLKLDKQSRPHICATYFTLPLRYAHLSDKGWQIEEIAPEDNMSVQEACSVGVTADGTVHLSWYRVPYTDHTYAHMRYAVLKNGVWLMKTLDYDMQTGKWNSMIIDPQGNPEISYDAFVKGLMKVAYWNGNDWTIRVVDSRGAHGSDYSLGMGSNITLDPKGDIHVSYYTDTEVRHAWQEGKTWRVETVDHVEPTRNAYDYRTSLVVDRDGVFHISYEDNGVLKHAFRENGQWRIQIIAGTGTSKSRYNFMTADRKENILYIAFADPVDGALKVAVGRKTPPSQTASGESSNQKQADPQPPARPN
jgi:hypothetical protein